MQKRITAVIASLLLIVASVFVLASCDSEIYDSDGQQNGQSEQREETEPQDEPDSDDTDNYGDESKTHSDNAGSQDSKNGAGNEDSGKGQSVKKNGSYDQKDDVAEYLSIYKKLPKNYITKKEAKKLGWQGGSVEQVAPGKAIGGDHFGNYEKKLPNKKGRSYYECDIDTLGKKKRGPKRIIYSNDGLIYYTGDHYDSFRKMPQSA